MALELELPFADHDELDLGRVDDELLIRVGPYRRAIVLPDALRRRVVTDARLEEGCLTVLFADPPPGHAGGAPDVVDETGGTDPAGSRGPAAVATAKAAP